MSNFDNLGLSEDRLAVLRSKGFEKPTPIQEKTIPAIINGSKDVVGQAQTGTGKTAAFGIPLIELLDTDADTVQALILTPTRELAIQVADEIITLKGKKTLKVLPVYGGQSINIQLRSLRKGVDIVVGTPGRILDHLKRRTLDLSSISFLVLDEADEMLNMGFLEDVTEIIVNTNKDKRTMLFSATMPSEIMSIAKKHMKDYEIFKTSEDQLTVSQTDQIYFEVTETDKFEALCRIIDIEEDFYGLVFCRTKVDTDTIANQLKRRGYDADALHGDMSQNLRKNVLDKFRRRDINILVATDVAARGIDVQNLTHVINYNLPNDPESYVHRIGRTGRAGQEGNAITFITPQEYRKLHYIIRKARTDIRKAKLPDIKELIKTKKIRIKSDIEDIIRNGVHEEYMKFSKELLDSSEPDKIIGALLNYSFEDELDESQYTGIDTTVIDKKGKTRLFVKQGRKDGLTPGKLIDFIRSITGTQAKKIRDIEILDKFSFVTMPFNEAEKLLSYIKSRRKGSGIHIEKAKN